MQITKKAIKLIDDSSGLKVKLCVAFDATYDTMQRWVRENKKDGKLTTIKAITIIEESIGLTQTEILDTEE